MVVKVWAVEKDDPAFGSWVVGLKWSRLIFSDWVAGENRVCEDQSELDERIGLFLAVESWI